MISERQIKRIRQHVVAGGINNPAQTFLPKAREEKKFEKLSDVSNEMLIALLESRKMETGVAAEKAFMMSKASANDVKTIRQNGMPCAKKKRDNSF